MHEKMFNTFINKIIRHGIIHRDLHSDNILIKKNKLVLIDIDSCEEVGDAIMRREMTITRLIAYVVDDTQKLFTVFPKTMLAFYEKYRNHEHFVFEHELMQKYVKLAKRRLRNAQTHVV